MSDRIKPGKEPRQLDSPDGVGKDLPLFRTRPRFELSRFPTKRTAKAAQRQIIADRRDYVESFYREDIPAKDRCWRRCGWSWRSSRSCSVSFR